MRRNHLVLICFACLSLMICFVNVATRSKYGSGKTHLTQGIKSRSDGKSRYNITDKNESSYFNLSIDVNDTTTSKSLLKVSRSKTKRAAEEIVRNVNSTGYIVFGPMETEGNYSLENYKKSVEYNWSLKAYVDIASGFIVSIVKIPWGK